MKRIDGRAPDALRPVSITTGYQSFAEGSVLIELGKTHVLCSVTVEDKVPLFLKGSGRGWITAEYAMLPRATMQRTPRESVQGRVSGRSQEIQRLIGRSLRAVTDLNKLGERSLLVDCDVLQADGGTRTAAITGAYVAVYQALYGLSRTGVIPAIPLKSAVAATSAGVWHGRLLLDLIYQEDSEAESDFNVVMTSLGELVEVQGTAELSPYTRETLEAVLALTDKGIKQLLAVQQAAIEKIKASAR